MSVRLQPSHLCRVICNALLDACPFQDRKLAQEGLWAHATQIPEVGGLLIATAEVPELTNDPRLWQIVIFLIEHGPQGSRGLILNRPATAQVGDLLNWGYAPSQVLLFQA